jgi:hypothetical protein
MKEEVRTSLLNTAAAMESWAAGGRTYETVTMPDLEAEGAEFLPDVTVWFEATPVTYCLVAEHSKLPPDDEWSIAVYDSTLGRVMPDDSCAP